MTILIHSLQQITAQQQGGVVTIGHFDGVHIGHQHLIKEVRLAAQEKQVPALVIIFEPHAHEYFNKKQTPIARLTSLREKFIKLAACGIDAIIVLPFKRSLAQCSAPEFIQTLLYNRLKIKQIIIGEDFQFGRNRKGNIHLLQTLSHPYCFTTTIIPAIYLGSRRVSSTWVREALQQDNSTLIQTLLGCPYSMLGRIIYGKQLGQQLGFPTANIPIQRRFSPITGVYIVYMHGITTHPLPGVAHIGTQPTVKGAKKLLEVYLLDFKGDLYGKCVKVEFCKKLREDQHYPTLSLLRAQIFQDVIMARHYFKTHSRIAR